LYFAFVVKSYGVLYVSSLLCIVLFFQAVYTKDYEQQKLKYTLPADRVDMVAAKAVLEQSDVSTCTMYIYV